ncbi:Glycosyltransferase involved in cell wall bisynthesis [Pustulibacterium marinum]|uniref:Glycosyltransferase involved in cell wall bisynthesis n=1 Tax=Pustulibacterium marinum TaxID=1224947 RepID=A0A1I7HVU3_9FLAO|nr:glycosyltransferase family 2 protein [Pustulibacterium marinum]SFU64813.1 Glycosyltransferase involved in cell wall bisynthesis [Pustulibacterium marinum]
MQKLSAVVITLNEINYIKDCVKSISFADEIVIIDSFSTDGTWEYLQSLPHVQSSQHPFENYTSQKNYALQKASHNWVLFIDADEVIPPNLKNEILEILKSPQKDAYYIFRKFIMNGVPLKYCGFQTDKQLRLFNKENTFFEPERLVHERLITSGTTGILKEKLDHHFYKSKEDYTRRILFYGQLKGKELFLKNKKPGFFVQKIKPAFKFFQKYIIRFGILDGKNGYTISKINAKGVAERYKEVKRLRKQQS